MARRWRVSVRGSVPAPFADVVSWWTADERAKDLRRRVEQRLGETVQVAWTDGQSDAGTWVEARWTTPGRTIESRWRLLRHQPRIVEGPPPQVSLASFLTTEGSTRRGNRVITESEIETLFLDRGGSTEVRLFHSWTSAGAGIWRQLLTRRGLASVMKADFADLMLRCEASVHEPGTGQATTA